MRDRVLLALWTLGIVGCALFARPLAEALRGRGILAGTVWALSAAAFAGVVALLRDRPERCPPIPPAAIAATALAGAWLASWWVLPEERVHLAQYGPLGILAWRALGGRTAAALVLAAAIGAGDELLQGALPARTFDAWDVGANAVASGAGVLLIAGGRVAWVAPGLLIGARLLLHVGHTPTRVDPPAAEEPRPEPSAPPPQRIAEAPYPGASLLVLTIDALRRDRVPPWGHAAAPTPALDRLAAESLALDGQAVALWTTPSVVSLFTGLNPATHGVAGRGLELAPSVNTPLETLARAGWRVVGHAGDATETYRNLGLRREIDRERPPEDVAVEELRAGRTFLWLHLRQVHAPYDAPNERLLALGVPTPPPSPVLDRARTAFTVPRADFPGDHGWLRPAISALYDAEVADADAALGRILDAIDRAHLAPIVVLTADHGEELLERGGIGHASTTLASRPWPELIDVPLLVRLPDRRRAGDRQIGAVQQIDVLPSLLPLVGLTAEPAAPDVPLDGEDRALLDPTPRPTRPLLVHSSPCGWQCPPERRDERVSAVLDGDWIRCAAACPPAVQDRLDAAEARRRRLGTPVAAPAPGE